MSRNIYVGVAKDNHLSILVSHIQTSYLYILLSVEPISRRGIIIGIVLAFLSQNCGQLFLSFYSSVIFSGLYLPSDWLFIVNTLINIIGTLLASQLIETLGRKVLLIISLAGSAFGLTTLAAFSYYDSIGFDMSMYWWVAIASFGVAKFMASVGIVPLCMVCSLELMPTKVRSFGLTVVSMSTTIFLQINIMFLPFVGAIGVYASLLIFAVICLCGAIFVTFFVDETKGKTIDSVNETVLELNTENA